MTAVNAAALPAAPDCGLTVRQLRIVEIASRTGSGDLDNLKPALTAGLDDARTRYERGRDILAEISGVPADAPKAAYAEFAPVVERFLKEHLFADLFERDVLTYAERELATVSVIAVLGESVDPMLRSHMAVCRHLGMTQEQLDRVLAVARADGGACPHTDE